MLHKCLCPFFPCLFQALSLLFLVALLIFLMLKVLPCSNIFIHLVGLGFCRDYTLPFCFQKETPGGCRAGGASQADSTTNL